MLASSPSASSSGVAPAPRRSSRSCRRPQGCGPGAHALVPLPSRPRGDDSGSPRAARIGARWPSRSRSRAKTGSPSCGFSARRRTRSSPGCSPRAPRWSPACAPSRPAAVVLTGSGGFFSGGVDLKLAPTLSADEQRGMVAGINRMFADWYGFPRPVVAAVNGHAVAGGMILALCADHRVGSRAATLRAHRAPGRRPVSGRRPGRRPGGARPGPGAPAGARRRARRRARPRSPMGSSTSSPSRTPCSSRALAVAGELAALPSGDLRDGQGPAPRTGARGDPGRDRARPARRGLAQRRDRRRGARGAGALSR